MRFSSEVSSHLMSKHSSWVCALKDPQLIVNSFRLRWNISPLFNDSDQHLKHLLFTHTSNPLLEPFQRTGTLYDCFSLENVLYTWRCQTWTYFHFRLIRAQISSRNFYFSLIKTFNSALSLISIVKEDIMNCHRLNAYSTHLDNEISIYFFVKTHNLIYSLITSGSSRHCIGKCTLYSNLKHDPLSLTTFRRELSFQWSLRR